MPRSFSINRWAGARKLTGPTLQVSLFAFILVGTSTVVSEEPSAFKSPPTEFECRFTDRPVKIDGRADEDAWKAAQPIESFYLPWLQEKVRAARTATRAKLLWDRENLYFFAEMDDSDLFADVTEHDGKTWSNDVFELFFKPAQDKQGYYEFQVNAAGTKLDVFFPRRGAGNFDELKKEGEFNIESKVLFKGTLNKWQDKDKLWSVEGKIPWRGLLRTGGRPDIDEKWKFNLARYDYSVEFGEPELSTCAPLKSLNYANFHHHEDYATLKFVGPRAENVAGKLGIEKLAPLVTSRVVGSPDPPLPYRVVRALPNLKLTFPICVARVPDSNVLLFVDQQRSYGPARLARAVDAPDSGEAETIWTPSAERVAYGITFHPDFKKNGYVYIGSNGHAGENKKKHTRVSRFTMQPEAPHKFDAASEVVIIEWASDGHNGGDMAFGKDGMLYVTSGDGTSDSDTNVTGQDLTLLLAKVLRIDVDHPAEGKQYSVPKDNPFLDLKDARPETWAYGFRNPWRIHIDKESGRVWVGNNGQDLWEQVFLVERGANYGWSVMEGSHPFYLNRRAGPTPFSKPACEHPHSEARSLTGGVVYYGEKLPELRGAYIYGDHSTGKIWGVKHDGKQIVWHKELADTTLNIPGFGHDSHGELLVLDHRGDEKGGFYYLEPSPPDTSAAKFPRKLSETGLFASVARHEPAAGLVPYSVNAELWSDGALKERFIAIPHKEGEDRRIDIGTNRGWNFPDETVLVKSFALEMQPGDAASKRYIETRLLTKQQGEWVGYSYIWNDEQTEATLVESGGLDRTYELRVPKSREHPSGAKKLAWHYPSRTECMVCHSRAANYVLGLSEVQMNKLHDYGHGAVDNQLRVLEHLGMLKVNWQNEVTAAMKEEAKARGLSENEANKEIEKQTKAPDQRKANSSKLLSKPPEKYKKLVDPYDAKQDLNARARSYLHANCSQCHVEAGGGNAKLEIEFTTPAEKLNLIDAVPVHHKFDLPDARLVAPGHPERSVLLHRLSIRGPGQMPQLATSLVDEAAVKLFREWIANMKEEAKGR
jgi:uncharacterized repeat protein (TIGR03806 family)